MSEITKADYDLYDSVVTTIMRNVLVERRRCGKFFLYDFHPENDAEKLYFNVAAIAADLHRENLYIDVPFWTYIKLRLKFRKRRTNLKRVTKASKKEVDDEFKTSVYILMDFIAKGLDISTDLFKTINDAYYGWVD